MEENKETAQTEETEEVEKTEDGQSEEGKSETDSKAEEKDESESKEEGKEDEDLIELPTGDKVTFKELLSGYMKDADYRKKTAALSEEKKKAEFMPQKEVNKDTSSKDDSLKKYDPKALEEFKALAKSIGFVSKDELQAMTFEEKKQSVVDSFFAKHTEYLPENDSDDMHWNALKEELSLYNLNDLKNLPKVLEKAHSEVSGKFNKSSEAGKAALVRERMKAASVGSKGSGSSPSKSGGEEYTPEQIEVMKQMGVYE